MKKRAELFIFLILFPSCRAYGRNNEYFLLGF